jgi:hypothetical protein
MIINGTANNDDLYAQKGDQVFGLEGNDILDASNGNGNNTLDGGAGNDELYANHDDTLLGGDGDDDLYAQGTLGNNSLNGGAGKDSLFVIEGNNNTLAGDAGDDELYISEGSFNTLKGGIGNDLLRTFSTTGNNTLEGGDGNDILIGLLASDRLFGDAGDDLLYAGKQGTQMTGGSGKDSFYLGNGSVPQAPGIVLDFKQNEDQVIVAGIPEVAKFNDLILEQIGTDTSVKVLINGSAKEFGILKNIQATSLTANDFGLKTSIFSIADAEADNLAPIFAITSASSEEGNNISFTVTRTGDSQAAQNVTVATSIKTGDTASANDFTAKNETLTFALGETTKTFTVATAEDFQIEGNETFSVSLNSATNGATISSTNGTAKGTINNDDISLAAVANNNIFNIKGVSDTVRLKVTLIEGNSSFVNELGVFTVDDAEGRINGIAPGQQGYNQEALNRAKNQGKAILSAIAKTPNGFNNADLSRLLGFNSGSYLQFFLVKNSTIDSFRAGSSQATNIVFFDSSTQKITKEENGFTLAWNSGSSGVVNFNDLVVKIESTDASLTTGTALQGTNQAELIDLTGISSVVQTDFSVFRDAAYNSEVYFYKVDNAQGQIGSLQAISANRANYLQSAINNIIKDAQTGTAVKFATSNQSQFTSSAKISGGSILAPMIIVNGSLSELTDTNTTNDPQVYFPYLGVNSDGVDHIRLLGDNTFGFEDLANGGDFDYNDLIIKLNVSIS